MRHRYSCQEKEVQGCSEVQAALVPCVWKLVFYHQPGMLSVSASRIPETHLRLSMVSKFKFSENLSRLRQLSSSLPHMPVLSAVLGGSLDVRMTS